MKKSLFSIVLLSLLSISCTSTKIVSSWHEPSKEVTIDKLNKVLVVALFKTETTEHKAEDQMVGYLKGKGVASYNYFNASFDKSNEAAIYKKIKNDDFDGAVTMRLIDVDKEKVYNPGETNSYPINYRNFSGYYFDRWNQNKTPGYYTTSKTYTVETNVYSIKMNKIIWSGITETTNPDGLKNMTDEIAKVIYKKMIQEGFINK